MENICQKYIYNTYNLQVQIHSLNIYSKSFKYFHSCEENQIHKEIEPVKKYNLKKIGFAKDKALFSKCENAQKIKECRWLLPVIVENAMSFFYEN